MTLEQMYQGDETGTTLPGYAAARKAKIRQIAEYLLDHVKPTVAPILLAQRIMDAAEEMGRIRGDVVSGEIPERYALRGVPIPFEI